MKYWCFYHSSDFDGHCSGAIVRHFIKMLNDVEPIMVGINYGQDFPWSDIAQDDVVYMVDFGLQPFNDMVLLNSICNLIWIDHHNTVINDIDESGIKFDGIQRDGIGACALCWEYFVSNKKPLPYGVKLLAEYDVWDHSNKYTLPFQYGLRLNNNTFPDSGIWDKIINKDFEFLRDTIQDGKVALKYDDMNNELFCKSYSFDTEINGLKAIAVNKGICSSRIFRSVWDADKYDCMLTFCRSKESEWFCSIYSDKEGVDVSKTAVLFGGGGHKQAAGFQCKVLPFEV